MYNLVHKKKHLIAAKEREKDQAVMIIAIPSPEEDMSLEHKMESEEVVESTIEEKIETLKEEIAEMECCLSTPTTIDEFISTLFSIRTTLHLHHLYQQGVGGFAGHLALQDLYESTENLVDVLSETCQTETLLELKVPASEITSECLDFVKEILTWIRANRNLFPYSFSQNEIDEYEKNLSRCIYKLTFLK